MQLRSVVRLAGVALLGFCVLGCNGAGKTKPGLPDPDGLELSEMTDRLQQAVSRVMASELWQPFAAEAGYWAKRCAQEADAAVIACVQANDKALEACDVGHAKSTPAFDDYCRRILSGDRGVCVLKPPASIDAGVVAQWCASTAKGNACATTRGAERQTCEAKKAVPALTLLAAQIEASVVSTKTADGGVKLFVLSFGASSKRQATIKVDSLLTLRPAGYVPTPGAGALDRETWSPRAQMYSEAREAEMLARKAAGQVDALDVVSLLVVGSNFQKVAIERSEKQVERSCSKKTPTDVDRMVCTIESTLLATTVKYLQSPDGQRPSAPNEGEPRPLSPLRPKSFEFRFAVDVSRKKEGGFELDLKPVPKSVKFGGSETEAAVNTLTLKFGPEP